MRTNDEQKVKVGSMEAKSQKQSQEQSQEQLPAELFPDLETAVDEAIAACEGDSRATVRALVIANNFLYAEVERFRSMCSPGLTRGRLTLRDLP
jgi:hypothetical protein